MRLSPAVSLPQEWQDGAADGASAPHRGQQGSSGSLTPPPHQDPGGMTLQPCQDLGASLPPHRGTGQKETVGICATDHCLYAWHGLPPAGTSERRQQGLEATTLGVAIVTGEWAQMQGKKSLQVTVVH